MTRTWGSEVFLSYARKDNEQPVDRDGHGWVTAFDQELKRRHHQFTGKELRTFFDRDAIDAGVDWRRRLGLGLRDSRLFLAFLTPNYITSDNCLWEWEQYLLREHSAARGDDGVVPIFFVTLEDLLKSERTAIEDWLAAMEQKYPWFHRRAVPPTAELLQRTSAVRKDLARRNAHVKLELTPWIERGPDLLRELDAAVRSAAVTGGARDPSSDVRSLDERLAGITRHIADRLERMELADRSPGNIGRSNEHFVGRHRELCQLHDIMLTGGPQSGGSGMGGRGMIAAAFSPGGLGKTALARQYAHAYAEFYVAGGIWELRCEGQSKLGNVLAQLCDFATLRDAGLRSQAMRDGIEDRLVPPLVLSEGARKSAEEAAREIIAYLRRLTSARAEHIEVSLPRRLEHRKALLILDNVDRSELLAARELSALAAEDWLEVLVTTRLSPKSFGGDDRVFAEVELRVLPPEDALRLLADFQPGHCFESDDEEVAAREVAQLLGGWTIAVEIAAALVGERSREGDRTAMRAFLIALQEKGLAWIDDLTTEAAFDQRQSHRGDEDDRERQRQNRVGTMIEWSLARLSEPARYALRLAAVMMPDEIPLEWLQSLCAARHPDPAGAGFLTKSDSRSSWLSIWAELRGLRLLHPVGDVQRDRPSVELAPTLASIHRLVAEHVRRLDPEARETRETVERWVHLAAARFEEQVGQGDDAEILAWHPWLLAQCEHLLGDAVLAQEIGASAGVASTHEALHGSLERAIALAERRRIGAELRLRENPQSVQASRDVSVSLNTLGNFLSQRGREGDAQRALEYFERALAVSESLLASNPQSAQAARDVSVNLNTLGAFLSQRGREGDAQRALDYFQRCHSVLESLLTSNPQSAQAARDVSVSLNTLGDFLSQRSKDGDAQRALDYFERCHSVLERLLASNPQSAQAARDVSVSLNKLGDFLSQRSKDGDAQRALEYFERSLSVSQSLLSRNPQSAQTARDVSVSLIKLGEFLSRRGREGDAQRALEYFERSLSVSETLLATNPQSAQAARDVSVSLERLGDFLSQRGRDGDAQRALDYFERSLSVNENLLATNPQSAQVARAVSISLERLGDFLSQRGGDGDAQRALEYFERSLSVSENLLATNPQSALAARDVSVSLNKLGDFLSQRGRDGDAQRALEYFERSLSVSENLLSSNPHSAQAARDVSISLNKLGDFLSQRGRDGDAQRAQEYFERSLAVRESLLSRNPQSAQAARDVSVSLSMLGAFLSQRGRDGDAERALEYFERSLSVSESLLSSNPQSAQAARDVSIGLNKLGDFLSQRRREGDAARALGYFERSLAVSESLLSSNPQSALAARDVLISLERLSAALSGREGGMGRALELQQRSLALAMQLRAANPDSYFHQRSAAISAMRTYQVATQVGDSALAAQSLAQCEAIIEAIVRMGMELDPVLQSWRETFRRIRGE
ncbi:MAG: TIR domain-containing protein [Planctomycetota bacterium]